MKLLTRAWRFDRTGGPEVLRLTEEEIGPPGPGEALIRIRAIGLNRSDLLQLAGRYYGPPPRPSFLGQEAVGEILALGPQVESHAPAAGFVPKVGMLIGLMPGRIDYAGYGTYREAGVFPQSALLPLPAPLTLAEGAGLWVAAMTAVGGLVTGGLGARRGAAPVVLITAASSGVGVTALQVARAMGAGELLAVTTSAAKADRLAALADRVVVIREPAELVAAVRAARGASGGIDLAFDPVGFSFAHALMDLAAPGGRIVFYGILGGTEAPFDLRLLILKDLAVHGFTVYRLQRDGALLDDVVRTTLDLVRSGALKPVIASEYPFAHAPEALAALARNQHVGKIVVHVA